MHYGDMVSGPIHVHRRLPSNPIKSMSGAIARVIFICAAGAPLVVPGFQVTTSLVDYHSLASPASPKITLSVDHGPPGTLVTIAGSGFPPSEIAALYLDSPSPYLDVPGPRADSQGSFQQNITMPGKGYDPAGKVDPTKVGPHNICADTGYPGSTQPIAVKACAVFTVEPGPSPTTASSSPQPGPASPALPIPAVLVAFGVLAALAIGTFVMTRRPR
jgi:hypothetical protein